MVTNRSERKLKIQPKGIVVDDDSTWQATFARALNEGGLSADRVSSLSEAENRLDREFFHVALVDLSLVENDNLDGLQVMRKIYDELREGTAAILLTAYGGAPEGAEAKGIGAFEVFSKRKLEYGLLLEAIQRALHTSTKTLDETTVDLSWLTGWGDRAERNLHEHRIVEALGCGVRPVQHLATTLLRKVLPVLHLATNPAAAVERSEGTVRATYWSKMLGAPILLLLGGPTILDDEVSRLNEGGNADKVLNFESHGDLAGAVFLTEGPRFEAFEKKRRLS